jgi:hypothetical protein
MHQNHSNTHAPSITPNNAGLSLHCIVWIQFVLIRAFQTPIRVPITPMRDSTYHPCFRSLFTAYPQKVVPTHRNSDSPVSPNFLTFVSPFKSNLSYTRIARCAHLHVLPIWCFDFSKKCSFVHMSTPIIFPLSLLFSLILGVRRRSTVPSSLLCLCPILRT